MSQPSVLVVPCAGAMPEVLSDRQWWLKRHVRQITAMAAAAVEMRGRYAADYAPGWYVIVPGDPEPLPGVVELRAKWGEEVVDDELLDMLRDAQRETVIVWTIVDTAARGRDS